MNFHFFYAHIKYIVQGKFFLSHIFNGTLTFSQLIAYRPIKSIAYALIPASQHKKQVQRFL